MLSQDEFQKLIGEITAAEFPSEAISFKFSGAREVGKLYSQGETATSGDRAGELLNQFAGGADSTAVLEFIKLAAGTLLVVKQVWDAWHPKKDKNEDEAEPKESEASKEESLKVVWYKHLIEAGLPEEKATSIVERFSGDLQKRLA